MDFHGLQDAVVKTVCANWRLVQGDRGVVESGTKDPRVLALIDDIYRASDPAAFVAELEDAAKDGGE